MRSFEEALARAQMVQAPLKPPPLLKSHLPTPRASTTRKPASFGITDARQGAGECSRIRACRTKNSRRT
jgi:hypothetical protein